MRERVGRGCKTVYADFQSARVIEILNRTRRAREDDSRPGIYYTFFLLLLLIFRFFIAVHIATYAVHDTSDESTSTIKASSEIIFFSPHTKLLRSFRFPVNRRKRIDSVESFRRMNAE